MFDCLLHTTVGPLARWIDRHRPASAIPATLDRPNHSAPIPQTHPTHRYDGTGGTGRIDHYRSLLKGQLAMALLPLILFLARRNS